MCNFFISRFLLGGAPHKVPNGTAAPVTKQDRVWNWTMECEKAFENITLLVTEATKLAYFDNDKEAGLLIFFKSSSSVSPHPASTMSSDTFTVFSRPSMASQSFF